MKSIVTFGVAALLAVSTPAALAQGGGAPEWRVSLARMPVEATAAVKGAPYFAEVVTESVQTLADGNRIVRKTTGRVYRDGQGRIRREEDREAGHVRTVSITDPVGGAAWSLNPETKLAWKTPYQTAGAVARKIEGVLMIEGHVLDPLEVDRRKEIETKVQEAEATVKMMVGGGGRGRGAGGMVSKEMAWHEKVEKLPARQIEGVMAEGTRTTRTIPAGVIGNEQPIAIVTEQWRSPDLNVLVLTRTADPRSGETTYRLLGITRGEPDPSWFTVPADYTVRESGIKRDAPRP